MSIKQKRLMKETKKNLKSKWSMVDQICICSDSFSNCEVVKATKNVSMALACRVLKGFKSAGKFIHIFPR